MLVGIRGGDVPELEIRVDADLGCVFEDVGCYGFAVDRILGDTVLIDAYCCQCCQSSSINLCTSVGDNTHNDLSPTFFTPHFRPVPRTQVCNVLHDTMHCPCKQHFVLIVQRNNNEQFRSTRLFVKYLTKRESFFLEVCRITCCSRIPHMRELAILLVGKGSQKARRNRTIKNQVTLEQVDPFHRFEATGLSWGWFAATNVRTCFVVHVWIV